MDEPIRQFKHIGLEGSIMRISDAVSTLEDFVLKVKEGQDPPPKDASAKDPAAPSLEATLDNASGKLENIRERILKAISELDPSLF